MSKTGIAVLSALIVASSALAFAHEQGEHDHQQAVSYGQPGDAGQPSRDVVVVMKEAEGRMMFEPATIAVTSGEQIRFVLKNEGELDHEFVFGTAAEIADHAEMMKVMPDMKHTDANSMSVKAKVSGEVIWQFATAGEIEFACLVPGHMEAGMKGKIIVK